LDAQSKYPTGCVPAAQDRAASFSRLWTCHVWGTASRAAVQPLGTTRDSPRRRGLPIESAWLQSFRSASAHAAMAQHKRPSPAGRETRRLLTVVTPARSPCCSRAWHWAIGRSRMASGAGNHERSVRSRALFSRPPQRVLASARSTWSSASELGTPRLRAVSRC